MSDCALVISALRLNVKWSVSARKYPMQQTVCIHETNWIDTCWSLGLRWDHSTQPLLKQGFEENQPPLRQSTWKHFNSLWNTQLNPLYFVPDCPLIQDKCNALGCTIWSMWIHLYLWGSRSMHHIWLYWLRLQNGKEEVFPCSSILGRLFGFDFLILDICKFSPVLIRSSRTLFCPSQHVWCYLWKAIEVTTGPQGISPLFILAQWVSNG